MREATELDEDYVGSAVAPPLDRPTACRPACLELPWFGLEMQATGTTGSRCRHSLRSTRVSALGAASRPTRICSLGARVRARTAAAECLESAAPLADTEKIVGLCRQVLGRRSRVAPQQISAFRFVN